MQYDTKRIGFDLKKKNENKSPKKVIRYTINTITKMIILTHINGHTLGQTEH
jgi:hypothetical protein